MVSVHPLFRVFAALQSNLSGASLAPQRLYVEPRMCLFSARYVEGAFVVGKVRTMGKPHVSCQPKLAGLSKHGRAPYTYVQDPRFEDRWANHKF